MSLFLKPRGFWDYTLFALALTGALVLLFWLEARDRVSWADAALAFGAALLCVLVIILARQSERASWIAQPSLYLYSLASFGAFALTFGAVYADAYLLHRREITSDWLRHNTVLVIASTVGTILSSLRRHRSKR